MGLFESFVLRKTSELAASVSAKADAAHTHSAADITGLAPVATTGLFSSLTGAPALIPTLYKVLDASALASNSNTDQPWFPSAGGVSVTADTLYRFEGTLIVSHGTTSCAIGIGFGGTATTNFISYQGTAVKRVLNTNGNNAQMAVSDSASNLQTSTSNTVGGSVLTTTGILSVDAAGTLIPQFRFSAAPGGIPSVRAGTHFQLTRLGTDADLTRGTWA